MAIINPVGYLHNVSTHTAQVDRLASLGLLLPASSTELRARGGVRMPGDFAITAQATPNMSINVAPGICYVPAATSAAGTYDIPNDAALVVSVTAAHASLNRNDLVVARVQDSFYSGSNNTGDVIIIPGTAASTPTDPALPAGAVYTILARIVVRAGTTSILSTDITMLVDQVAPSAGIPALTTTSGLAANGQYVGQYRDHPTAGLQRWNGTSWVSMGILPVGSGDVNNGQTVGQYRDHPTYGLQRWDGTQWKAAGVQNWALWRTGTASNGLAAQGMKIFAAQLDLPFGGNSFAVVSCGYPSGFFTEIPVVQVTFAGENTQAVYGGTDNHTAAGCSVIFRSGVNIAGTVAAGAHVLAIGR